MRESKGKKRSPQTFFVSGTDTGVGKTYIASGLARALYRAGINVGVMKPVETGWRSEEESDAYRLAASVHSVEPLELVCPYRFRAPLAPQIAAEQEGRIISKRVILSAHRRMALRHDILLVEGAGGLMVPVNKQMLMIDLAKLLEAKIILVCADKLGCINHTLLSLEAAHKRGVPITAVIMNRHTAELDESTDSNQRAIEKWGNVTTFIVPFRAHEKDFDALAEKLFLIGGRRGVLK